jgi:hypothetical protein
MQSECKAKIEWLLEKGVNIPFPDSVIIGKEVDPDRIAAEGVVIHPGCKLLGPKTLIMEGVKLGYEGPVTLDDCQLGRKVELKGGYFQRSIFLEKAEMALGAHVREGCILEEEASGAHNVGLKQTILFPFVTLGSLVNFCDCLMAGGTSRRDHSEVGSSYIHFNYTPSQDKATASLIGDVPRGVMLNQPPIFLGGQGGLVGPVRIEYGTVIAAGVVYRRDILEPGRLLLGHAPIERGSNFQPAVYWNLRRIAFNNTNYIANLIALRHWYKMVRSLFFERYPMGKMLHEGLLETLDMAVEERLRRFEGLSQKMPESAKKYRAVMKAGTDEKLLRQKEELSGRWSELEALFRSRLEDPGDNSVYEPFLEEIERHVQHQGPDYLRVIRGLDEAWSARGTQWLQSMVDVVTGQFVALMPSYGNP